MTNGSLFDSLGDLVTPMANSWRPEAPPQLDQYHEIELDCETNGLKWWAGDRPIGISICMEDGRTQYLPWGHKGGGNLQEEQVKRWAQRELRGKRITNLNTRFDIHMMREWGIDLEAQGNEVSDVGHYAALLDDHRQHLSLESIGQDYLGIGKHTGLDKTRMAQYHAGEVAAYAEQDTRLVHDLKKVMWPLLTEQDLHRVRALEDKVIYVVCEMEKNGAPIDVELLEHFIKESRKKINANLMDINHQADFKINIKSGPDMHRLFQKLGLPVEFTDPTVAHPEGQPSFTAAILNPIEHPLIKLINFTKKLMSQESKYFQKYRRAVDSNGILRYSLHQLRATKEEDGDAGEAGTVTGRFSSTAPLRDPDSGINVQQERKVEKQRIAFGYNEKDKSHDEEIFIIRKLRVPRKGEWLAADAKQIEYRMFASYANNPQVIQAYKKDPDLSFHKYMHEVLQTFVPDFSYGRTKDCNFAKVYAAGLIKLALMFGMVTKRQAERLREEKAKRDHPMLREAARIIDIYDELVPEVGPLLAAASHVAMPECNKYCKRGDAMHRRYKHKGYVCTLDGRRGRFPNGQRVHKAFNFIVQGGAASVNKMKLVELHDARFDTGFLMRYTVHDEVDGDAQEPDTKKKVAEILDRQSFPQLRVPILWDVKTGKNWAECA